jgi:biotin synthase-related radical SAM superfamily protein
MSSRKQLRPTEPSKKVLPDRIRVSSGSAIILGLIDGFLNAKPTTAYLLTYRRHKCTANCGFCPQATASKSRADLLSRVTWPVFASEEVISRLATAVRKGEMKRICVQALNYPAVLDEIGALVREMKLQQVDAPISVSCQPMNTQTMQQLLDAKVDRLGIALDAATKAIFDQVKGCFAPGPYDWDQQHHALLNAVKVFGEGRVTTHLIVGLGETEREMVKTLQWCVDHSVNPGLFAFTPIPGTALESRPPPAIDHYRRIQLARHLTVEGKTRLEEMTFDERGRIAEFGVSSSTLEDAIRGGSPFMTSGCPHCNRPYYNEKPSGPLYNFPSPPAPQQIDEIRQQLGLGAR